MKRIVKLSIIFCFLISLFGFVTTTNAAEKTSAMSFSKKVKHPENQITSGEALNLMMTPGQKQQVEVELQNYSDKEIEVESKITGARTNGNGGLEYSPNKFPKDKTMKYDLSDLLESPASVKVPPKGKANLVLNITMPDTAYDGIVTGGVQLMQKDHSIKSKEKDGSMINNKFAFVFGVTLRMTNNDVAPDFALRKVKAGTQNYRNSILIDVANVQSMIGENLAINAEITQKGKKEILYQKKKTEISIAPNSIMNYAVGLDGDRMRAGDYTANIVLKGYNKEWKWKQDFKITDEEADKFNNEDPYLVQERGLDWKTIAIIVGGVLVIAVIIIVVLKMTKKNTTKKLKKKSKKRR